MPATKSPADKGGVTTAATTSTGSSDPGEGPGERGLRRGGKLRPGLRGRSARQVGQELVEVALGAGAQGTPGPVVELGLFQPARLEVVAQFGDGRVAVGVGHPEPACRVRRVLIHSDTPSLSRWRPSAVACR